jgi:hypothetical protein
MRVKAISASIVFALQVAAGLLVSTLIMAEPARADYSRNAFCGRWHQICRTTCPAGVPIERCHAVCQGRLGQCAKTGCYHFNQPRPRCQGID